MSTDEPTDAQVQPSGEPPQPAPRSWLARILALVLGGGLLATGTLAIDKVGQLVPGTETEALMYQLRGMAPGDPVVMGNSVAGSAVEIEQFRTDLGLPNIANAIASGTGPISWYVLYTQHLRAMPRPPEVLILVTSMNWLIRTQPLADRDYALEFARYDDPTLASLMGVTPRWLGWERRLAARLRVRDAMVNVLAKPLAAYAARSEPEGTPGFGPIERAIALTLGGGGGNQPARIGSLVNPADDPVHPEVFWEVEPSFLQLLNAATEAGTRVLLVLLPSRSDPQVRLSVPAIIDGTPSTVQVVDMTEVPFEYADFQDFQHFAPEMRDSLSHVIAGYVSMLWLSPAQRSVNVVERPPR